MTLSEAHQETDAEAGRLALSASAEVGSLTLSASDQETLDELTGYGLRIIQPRHGYRFSVDPLLLARLEPSAHCTGAEFQEVMADIALRNAALNGLSERVQVIVDDVVQLRRRFPVSSFDLVVSNPPYRRVGTGKVSPRAGRDNARHESTATLVDFLSAAKYLVKESGRICFIYHTCRLAELMAQAAVLKLAVLRLRMVHGSIGAPARMFLVELMKGRTGELQVEPPLMVREGDGRYSSEKLRIYRGLQDQEPD